MTDTLTHRVEPGGRRDRRRRRVLRRRMAWGALGLIPVLVLAIVALTRSSAGGGTKPVVRPVGGTLEGGQVTYLLVGTRKGDPTGQADWLTLLAIDRSGRNPLTLFIPASTLAELPGYGFDSIGKGLPLGRVSLQQVAVENMLGVAVDHTMLMPQDLLAKIIDRAGGIDLTVPARLQALNSSGQRVTVLQAGAQHLDGDQAARYVAYRGPDEGELGRFVRAQAVWEALYTRFGSRDAGRLAEVFAGLGSDLATDAPPADAGALFAAFSSAGVDARAYLTLPVTAVSTAGPEDAFRVDQAGLDRLVHERLMGSLPPAGVGRGARLQILNGNGRPEIGARVAAVVVPAGFRVTDSGNASSFGFARTKVIVYREADVPIAERIRGLLGLGSIEISLTPQTIVDVTIIVGHDYASRTS